MCDSKGNAVSGSDVIAALAKRFPQLHVAPAEDALEANRAAAGRGVVPANANLDHFLTSPDDLLREVDTPAGTVEVVFLKERVDFETFLQIVGYKSQPVPIARTIGAVTYRGLADWGQVANAYMDYIASGGDDWPGEFRRLAKQPGAFRTEIVIISEGPYSNISADETAYTHDEWIRVSREIRLHHECAHVVCRRMLPEDVLAVWDEITADVVGLLFATGSYDVDLAARFLGVTASGFADGRLSEYLDDSQSSRIDDIAVEVHNAIERIGAMCGADEKSDPFGFLLQLKANPFIQY
ncbi:MAG: hypothetical protein IJH04_05280 [Eggerthellaceae bacterium]|nr:hypothetical protein [Eggerthellaceae bacterium]